VALAVAKVKWRLALDRDELENMGATTGDLSEMSE
jgi:hypothetical protein